jgi:hypothetical protein
MALAMRNSIWRCAIGDGAGAAAETQERWQLRPDPVRMLFSAFEITERAKPSWPAPKIS